MFVIIKNTYGEWEIIGETDDPENWIEGKTLEDYAKLLADGHDYSGVREALHQKSQLELKICEEKDTKSLNVYEISE